MIWPTALRLAAENAALRRENRELTYRLVHAQQECERLHVSLQRTRRDSDLLALMARDRKVALEFIRTAHAIDRVGEAS